MEERDGDGEDEGASFLQTGLKEEEELIFSRMVCTVVIIKTFDNKKTVKSFAKVVRSIQNDGIAKTKKYNGNRKVPRRRGLSSFVFTNMKTKNTKKSKGISQEREREERVKSSNKKKFRYSESEVSNFRSFEFSGFFSKVTRFFLIWVTRPFVFGTI